ncbi:hypothetical protein PCASD_20611 [Puccinia coronata f. sp. avenae]|uniref:DUF659 domain-containing protein n=1 Tax=Puccinia coronata f. sp. avenae TaxID=200324 RepID=A0A2N5SU03_9BASI|nr:hypothetical protein PCASD_20611 [Puccinia coronata f. sp. avenae]
MCHTCPIYGLSIDGGGGSLAGKAAEGSSQRRDWSTPAIVGSFCRGSAGGKLHLAGRQSSLQVAQWQLRWRCSYPCKTCGKKINQPIYKTSPTNLAKHVASCTKKERESQGTQKLAAMGILGTGDIDPQEVPQLCAIWCAQGARPSASLGESSHLGIVHPTVIKNLPKHKMVSRDIAKLYTAIQESLVELFKHHKGAMYLGLNAWQSPNGIDILGMVLYWLIKEEEGGFHLEAVPLDFVRLQKSHTGAYLAKTVQLIVEKFGLKEKIHGIVTDNALNNQTIIKEIKSYWWPLFKGKTH